ncbi:Hsp70 family protein [Mycobacterium noviomagense]|uniref:Molecular chaperone n=1 Tax=Mycobacterium noviomagense TaxID=459858 RepID=A0A7I7PL34_9MYCO|nr:Hsp70 family protein [Mycobacterium noviomagense]ORB11964.1 hypothetical protein BST37_17435 [Mycobacterium noviomagense]BBY09219.1 hypothetical protein MNVI_45370 [Mycobacterium noviomagense]
MANGERPAVGLSIGATNLAAVTADRAVTRKPVLTLYRGRPPEVGVPAENPNLTEPGLVITDFVDKIGDPAGIVAADGSTHRPETLVADALRVLAYTATGGRALPEAVAVSYPAHWAPPAVEALRAALSRVAEWSRGPQPVVLASDAAAALVALQANPGLPARGVIAVCDFGGTGTSLSLVDAANGYQPVVPTVRHSDFSGDQIDQALLNHVVATLSAEGSFDTAGTSAIGSLTRLRSQCRSAKEQLSSSTVATLSAELPGFSGDIQVTRAELDDVIRQPLDGFVAAIRQTMAGNGIGADLAAVAAVGGGANIPAVTTALSQLRVPVITAPRPHLTAAIGAALRAARGPADDSPTAVAPTMAAAVDPFAEAADPTMMAEAAPESGGAPALAWSEADDDSGIMPISTGEYPAPHNVSPATAQPPRIDRPQRPAEPRRPVVPWYRRPAVLVIGTALVVLALAAAIMIALRHTSGGGAPTTPSPSVSTTPQSTGTSAPSTESSSTDTTTVTQSSSSPSSTESTTTPPSSTQSTTTQPTTTQPTTTQPSTATTTQAPTTTSAPAPVAPAIPRIPGVPGFLQPGPGSGGQAG